MKIRYLIWALLLTSVTLAIVNVWISTKRVADLEEQKEVQESRASALRLAEKLRHYSDDLTRLARMYVETGNLEYKGYFNDVIAIRNGKMVRPVGYGRDYWDLVLAGRKSGPKRKEVTTSLSTGSLLEEASLTEDEINFLHEAKSHSNRLLEIEKQAFALLDRRGIESASEAPKNWALEREGAQKLLYGDAYLQARADAMELFGAFDKSVGNRTGRRLHELESEINRLAFWELGITSGLVPLLIVTSALILWRVITCVKALDNTVKQVGVGDLQVHSGVHGRDELGQFGQALDNMFVALAQNLLNLRSEKVTIEQRNRKLFEQNELKNQYVGMVAHDLKNPLVSIRGFSDFILRDESRDPAEQELVRVIHKLSSEMLDLVDQLLDVAGLESTQLTLHLRQISMRKLLEGRLAVLKLIAEKKSIRLNFCFSDEGYCIADEERIAEVIDNLVSNAIKFSPQGSTIRVTQESEEKWGKFVVADEGPGFTEEDKKKLFMDFQRLSAKPTGNESSTGLGLSIVKRIINLHNGQIEVESRLGEGAVFIVRLPR